MAMTNGQLRGPEGPWSPGRTTHPVLDFHVDVTVRERDGRYMATADLGEDSQDVGVRDTAQEAVEEALRGLGEPYVSEMVAGARSTPGRPSGP
jgi:hypothetical protein